ncbi:hypothetical protein MRX96_025942 [Rhipicephalus microplus]
MEPGPLVVLERDADASHPLPRAIGHVRRPEEAARHLFRLVSKPCAIVKALTFCKTRLALPAGYAILEALVKNALLGLSPAFTSELLQCKGNGARTFQCDFRNCVTELTYVEIAMADLDVARITRRRENGAKNRSSVCVGAIYARQRCPYDRAELERLE